MHLNPTNSFGTVTLYHYLGRASGSAHPVLWHPVSGCPQRELWNLSSALIHSPGRNIVTFMPFGLQKQLGSTAVLDIWCSNLSFLGRFWNLCSAAQALYRMTSWSSNCISQCTVSPLLPSLVRLPYSSLPEARERKKDWTVLPPSAMGKINCCHFWGDMQGLKQKSQTKGIRTNIASSAWDLPSLGVCTASVILLLPTSEQRGKDLQISSQKYYWITFM